MVSERGIDGSEEPRMRGHEQQQRGVRREQLSKSAQGCFVVLDVLEHVEADDPVERPLHVRGIALDDLDAVHSLSEHLGEEGIGFERHDFVDELTQLNGVGSDAGADVEDAAVQPRACPVDQPVVVGLSACHRLQVVGEGLRHAWEDRDSACLRRDHLVPSLGGRCRRSLRG